MSDLARDGSLDGISIFLHSSQTEVYLTLYWVRPVPRYAYGWELDFPDQSWMCGRPFFPFSVALGEFHDREVRWQSSCSSEGCTTYRQVKLPSCRCISMFPCLTVEEDLMHADVARTRPST